MTQTETQSEPGLAGHVRQLVTNDHTTAVLTHLGAAAFGMWAGIVKMGQWMDGAGVCTLQTAAACKTVHRIQADWQLWLTGIGLALVATAAAIELYQQQRGDAGD